MKKMTLFLSCGIVLATALPLSLASGRLGTSAGQPVETCEFQHEWEWVRIDGRLAGQIEQVTGAGVLHAILTTNTAVGEITVWDMDGTRVIGRFIKGVEELILDIPFQDGLWTFMRQTGDTDYLLLYRR